MPSYRIPLTLTLLAICEGVTAQDYPGTLRPGATVRITAHKQFDIPEVARLKGTLLTAAPGTKDLRDISSTVAASSESGSWWSVETAEGRTMVLPLRGQQTEGVLISMDGVAMTIQLREGKTELTLPLAVVRKMEVSTGRRRRADMILQGAVIGAVAGAAVGVVQGDDPPGFVSFSADEKAALFIIQFTTIGAVVGATKGAERWQPVEPGMARLNLTPTPKGAVVSLTFGFKGRHGK